MDDQLNYKTKCRVCGEITEWFYSTRKQTKWLDFANGMQLLIESPSAHNCKTCKESTVQDNVSYTNVR